MTTSTEFVGLNKTSPEKSPRLALIETLLALLRRVRGGIYEAQRGPINWLTYDFADKRRAAALGIADSPLFPVHGGGFSKSPATVVFDLYAPLPDEKEGVRDPDDGTLDEMYIDARYIVRGLIQAKDAKNGDSIVFGIPEERVTIVEVFDAEVRIQGVKVVFPVHY